MPGWLASFVVLVAVAGSGDRSPLVARGGDPARGVLIDQTPGGAVPGLPTVVFVHGTNPAPGLVHFEMAERLAEALGRRPGPPCNVLAWDWNAATTDSRSHKVNDRNAIGQGHALAAALLATALPPDRFHLIGHSAGAIVATSAARELARALGRPVAQLTLLDPATCYHRLVFERLHAGTAALRVENYWAPGPSGYGRAVACPHVRNVRVAGATPWLGTALPLRSSHLSLVRWYIATAEDPSYPGGFNASLLLGDGIRPVRPPAPAAEGSPASASAAPAADSDTVPAGGRSAAGSPTPPTRTPAPRSRPEAHPAPAFGPSSRAAARYRTSAIRDSSESPPPPPSVYPTLSPSKMKTAPPNRPGSPNQTTPRMTSWFSTEFSQRFAPGLGILFRIL